MALLTGGGGGQPVCSCNVITCVVPLAAVTGGMDRAETPSSSTQAKDTPQAEGWGGDDDWEVWSAGNREGQLMQFNHFLPPQSFSLPAEKGGRAAEQGEAGQGEAGQVRGWNDDDDWAPLETPQPQAKESASGAEFFDAFSDPIPSREAPLTKTSKPKMADTSRQQKTPPPFVSPALFQSKTEGSHKSDDGWGNEWTEDVTPKKPSQVGVSLCSHMTIT